MSINKVNKIKFKKSLLKYKKDTSLPRWFYFLEKIVIPFLIPLALGYLSYNLAENQSKLTQDQFKKQQTENEENKDLKYIELFYDDITSIDERKRNNAMLLFKLMKPQLAYEISKLINSNSSSDLITIKKSIEIKALNTLNNYTICIYYYNKDKASYQLANHIQDKLTNNGFQGKIQIKPADDLFYLKVNYSSGNQIRYEPDTEYAVADILENYFNNNFDKLYFFKQTIYGRTPNFISIFLNSNLR